MSVFFAEEDATQHPDIEKKVLEEINRVCPDGEITYYHVSQLRYLEAVFMETLRLHPSVPVNVRSSQADDVLPDGTFVPGGTTIIISLYAWARSSALWGKDCEEFKPERWLAEKEAQARRASDAGDAEGFADDKASDLLKRPRNAHNEFKYPTFYSGPRMCLGKHVAILEGVLVSALLLRKLKFTCVDPDNVTYGVGLLLTVKDGLQMKVTRR